MSDTGYESFLVRVVANFNRVYDASNSTASLLRSADKKEFKRPAIQGRKAEAGDQFVRVNTDRFNVQRLQLADLRIVIGYS